MFVGTVLRAAETAFARDFEGQLAETPGSPIRLVLTAATPFFPKPLAFYALLADEETVEIVDVVIDEDWLETLGDASPDASRHEPKSCPAQPPASTASASMIS
ncbi:MAG: hypothetical protein H0U41_05250 [Actinobacteria bacterium]|nr:hypothetical protein [Actinomycetota bacterium]